MKKILTFLFFFTALFLNTNFSYAKDFSANFSFAKVNISVVGKEAIMSITNTNGGADWWGRVEIWANKDNINGVIDSIFKEEVKDLNVGQTKKRWSISTM
jgi:hypothetical protein